MQTSLGWLLQGNEVMSGDPLPKTHPVTAGTVVCQSPFIHSGCETEQLRTAEGHKGSEEGSG